MEYTDPDRRLVDAQPSLGFNTRNLGFFTCAEVDFHDFFSPSKLKYSLVERHCLNFFSRSSTSQVVYDGKPM